MAKLLFVPQDAKDPKNHTRRVFFACHPEDMHLLEEVRADIAEHCDDFVMFYPDVSDKGDYGHLDEIANTQLFVVPVTERLLADKNGVLEHEFRKAIGEGLAILPILFDKKCEKEFNSVSGNRQYLLKGDPEYSEKLGRFLDDVLIKDELAERVRGVFSYRIFVSYCREDRAHAEDIIRLIHEKGEHRRIAVWFDKYLTLGKNFEDTIFEKLDGCDIFFMTVTPNIVGRENYVGQVEYPRARDGGKLVVMVEMANTDHSAVSSVFEGSDGFTLISAGDRKGTVRDIAFEISKLADPKNTARSPEINYLLGMAYLNGLDVEFDREYALKALTEAANGGVYEAIAQLVKMYDKGIGVARDGKKAIKWKKKAVEKRRYDFEQATREYDTMGIYVSGGEVKLTPAAQKELLKRVDPNGNTEKQINDLFGKRFEFYAEWLHDVTNAYCVELIECARLAMGECEYKQEKWCYQKLDEVKTAVYKRLPEADFLDGMSLSWDSERQKHDLILGGDYRSVSRNYERAKLMYEEEPENVQRMTVFAQCSQIFAFQMMAENKFGERVHEILLRAQELLRQVLGKNPEDTTAIEILIMTLRDMATNFCATNNDAAAQVLYEECLRLCDERQRIKPENYYMPYKKPEMYLYLGDIAHRAGESGLAYERYTAAIAELKAIYERSKELFLPADYYLGLYQFAGLSLARLREKELMPIDEVKREAELFLRIMDEDKLSGKSENYKKLRQELVKLV